jgi:hypothetical protein
MSFQAREARLSSPNEPEGVSCWLQVERWPERSPAWPPHPDRPTERPPRSTESECPRIRDWRLISVAHEEGNLNDLRAILGNDEAIEASREGTLPYPDGTIIARSPGLTSRRRKATKPLAVPSLSWPDPLRTGCSSWSRTRGSPVQAQTTAPKARRGETGRRIRLDRGLGVRSIRRRQTRREAVHETCPATRTSKRATLCSTVMHLEGDRVSPKQRRYATKCDELQAAKADLGSPALHVRPCWFSSGDRNSASDQACAGASRKSYSAV